jgi:hypothetical protein
MKLHCFALNSDPPKIVPAGASRQGSLALGTPGKLILILLGVFLVAAWSIVGFVPAPKG